MRRYRQDRPPCSFLRLPRCEPPLSACPRRAEPTGGHLRSDHVVRNLTGEAVMLPPHRCPSPGGYRSSAGCLALPLPRAQVWLFRASPADTVPRDLVSRWPAGAMLLSMLHARAEFFQACGLPRLGGRCRASSEFTSHVCHRDPLLRRDERGLFEHAVKFT